MFDRISPKYDALNHLLSFNIDKVWRRKTAKIVSSYYPKTILNLAPFTAISLFRRDYACLYSIAAKQVIDTCSATINQIIK